MKNRRLAIVGFSLVVALTFTAAGCKTNAAGTDATTPSGATTAAADPTTVLADAALALNKSSFKINTDLGLGTITGAMDATNKVGTMRMKMGAETGNMSADVRLVGSDIYMKLDIGGESLPGFDADKWIHLDVTRLPANNSLGIKPGEMDPAGAAKFLTAVATAEWADGDTVKGTLDLTKAIGAAGLNADSLSTLGEDAKKVPFEASTDDQGRLVKMIVELPAMGTQPARTMTTTYSDFGIKVSVTKPPAGEITEAPDALYGTLTA